MILRTTVNELNLKKGKCKKIRKLVVFLLSSNTILFLAGTLKGKVCLGEWTRTVKLASGCTAHYSSTGGPRRQTLTGVTSPRGTATSSLNIEKGDALKHLAGRASQQSPTEQDHSHRAHSYYTTIYIKFILIKLLTARSSSSSSHGNKPILSSDYSTIWPHRAKHTAYLTYFKCGGEQNGVSFFPTDILGLKGYWMLILNEVRTLGQDGGISDHTLPPGATTEKITRSQNK